MKTDLPKDPQQRLEAVKALTKDAENRAVGLLPEGDVQGVRQLDSGTFLRCGGGEYQWSGNVRVQLKPNVSGDSARELLASSASSQGFDVSSDKTSTGKTRAHLLDSKGVQLLVTAQEGGTVIDIDSGSPCFDLPEDFDVPREF